MREFRPGTLQVAVGVRRNEGTPRFPDGAGAGPSPPTLVKMALLLVREMFAKFAKFANFAKFDLPRGLSETTCGRSLIVSRRREGE